MWRRIIIIEWKLRCEKTAKYQDINFFSSFVVKSSIWGTCDANFANLFFNYPIEGCCLLLSVSFSLNLKKCNFMPPTVLFVWFKSFLFGDCLIFLLVRSWESNFGKLTMSLYVCFRNMSSERNVHLLIIWMGIMCCSWDCRVFQDFKWWQTIFCIVRIPFNISVHLLSFSRWDLDF